MPKKPEKSAKDKRPQIEKFRDTARELGADLDADKFNAALRKIAKANPDPKDIKAMADLIGQTNRRSVVND